MIPARLSIVTIGARDVEALGAFYERLGWKLAAQADDGFRAFETGGGVLTLYPVEALARLANLDPPTGAGYRGITLAINVEEGSLVDESIDTAREAGATILAEPEDQEWGGRTATFADPEGNVWEIAWMPGSSFDDRGALILPPS
ncbi:MAG TPA: VOC family protein [Actinomycetota bacterium]|nr:VOC family protein [Actinomycetota bacterium]